MYCHSEEPAGDEESRIVLKTLRARSIAAAQDDSIGAFFRNLFSPEPNANNLIAFQIAIPDCKGVRPKERPDDPQGERTTTESKSMRTPAPN